MTTLLTTVAPVFGIIIVGFAIVKLRVLDESGVKGLVLFVFNVAVPVLLFRSLATIEIPDDVRWAFLFCFYGGAFTCYGVGVTVGRYLFKRPLDHQAIFGMSSGFSNMVLLGVPILITAYGPEAALPIFLIIAFHSATLFPLTTILIRLGQGMDVSWKRQLRGVAKELVQNPIIVGLLLGFGANLAGVTLPGPVDRFAELLGGAAIPCALFAMGASLARYPLTGEVRQAIIPIVLKLVVHPLIVWTLAVPVLGLDGPWVPVVVTLAGMPSGVMVYMFAARYEAAPEVGARAVFLSTLCSMGTITFLLYLFAGG
ncbi:AEC family transporter [Gemmatimonadota bacterium]